MDDNPPPIGSKNRQFLEGCLDNVPFARAVWNFFVSEGKAVKSGWLAFILLGLICGWLGYQLSEFRSKDIIATNETSINALQTQLGNAERSRDTLETHLRTTEGLPSRVSKRARPLDYFSK
jgi:hypothetical protein